MVHIYLYLQNVLIRVLKRWEGNRFFHGNASQTKYLLSLFAYFSSRRQDTFILLLQLRCRYERRKLWNDHLEILVVELASKMRGF